MEDDCPTSLPNITQFQAGLGGWSYAMYSICSVNTVVLGIQYLFLVRQFYKTVDSNRFASTAWVTSIFFVISAFNLIGVVLPQASDFVWLSYKIYVSIAMGHFVDLTLSWYGGETAMLEHVGEDRTVNFRKPPCCCCLFLPKKTQLTKGKIRFLRGSVYQVPYVESFSLILLASIQLSGFIGEGNFSFSSPYIYITAILSFSYISGMWGLFMFFNITHKFDLLSNYNYKKKSQLMRVVIIVINFQGMIIDITNKQGGINCIPGHISASGMANIIKASCVIVESIVLGTISFLIYKDEGTYI